MNRNRKTVIHLIAQLRFGAGRCIVDMAVQQACGLKHHVIVGVSTDTDEYWRTDTKLVTELAGHGIEVRTIGDFFHRRANSIHQCGVRLRQLRGNVGLPFVVHAHTAMAAATGYWARPDALIATCHGWGTGRPADIDLEDSLAYQLCDSVLTYSNHWADRLEKDLSVSGPKVLSMGVNLDRFPPSDRHSIHDSAPLRMVTVCELTRRKGVDLLLDAMPALWRHFPEAELHIMGDGDAAGDLKHMAAEIDPGMRRISFHGAVADPHTRLGEYDLFILPSRSDNLPIALLEAMLAGLPVVAASVGGIPELISSAGCGTVVPAESAGALSEAIVESAKAGRSSMAAIGCKGERFVRNRLDIRKNVLHLESVYQEALQKRGSSSRIA
jgi:glycosyltransferase involved in cell wall biosynthesis